MRRMVRRPYPTPRFDTSVRNRANRRMSDAVAIQPISGAVPRSASRIGRSRTLWHEGRQPAAALDNGRGALHPVRFPGPVLTLFLAGIVFVDVAVWNGA